MKQILLKSSAKKLSQKIGDTLLIYFKSQFIVMITVTVVAWIVLSLLGVRYASALAFITGSVSSIPFLGMMTAAIIASLVAIFDDLRFLTYLPEVFEGIAVLGIYFLLNILTDVFLSPYLTGKITKVHPALLFISIVIGTAFFGILGTFFSVPVLLIFKTIWTHYEQNKSNRDHIGKNDKSD